MGQPSVARGDQPAAPSPKTLCPCAVGMGIALNRRSSPRDARARWSRVARATLRVEGGRELPS